MIDYKNANADEFLQITSVMVMAQVFKELAEHHPNVLQSSITDACHTMRLPETILCSQVKDFLDLAKRIRQDTEGNGPAVQRGMELAIMKIFGIDDDQLNRGGTPS